jgi:hypothetical protein
MSYVPGTFPTNIKFYSNRQSTPIICVIILQKVIELKISRHVILQDNEAFSTKVIQIDNMFRIKTKLEIKHT